MNYISEVKQKFKTLWLHYLLQGLIAALCMYVIALILGKERMVLVSAMGATTFIVFAMPNGISARCANIIGGHILGFASGAILSWVSIPCEIQYALAIGLVFILMVSLDFEHPPAAGTALAVVHNEVSIEAFATVMISAFILSQAKFILRDKLKDLV